MARALQLARNGELGASPNPMVGAVIVAPDGRIIGQGWHRRCGQGHAEVNAIADVAPTDRPLLKKSTIYVTLEPCSHYGKTPPCAKLLVDTGFKRVVTAMVDPNPLVSGRGIKMLDDAGIATTVGLLEDEARALNRRFITAQTKGRPWITLKWAQSADGYIDGRNSADQPPAVISNPATKALVHRERALHDAILVGRGTFEADNPNLGTTRHAGRSPRRFVLTSQADYPLPDGWEHLEAVTPEALAAILKSGITSVLVEGGKATLEAFLDAGLFDEIRIETNIDINLAQMRLKTAAPVLPTCTHINKRLLHNISTNLVG